MRALFLNLFILLMSFVIIGQEKKTITISTEEYPPYASKELENNGIDCQIVKEAFALENREVVFTFYSGARSFKMAKDGKVDGSVPWALRKDREKYFYYSDPIIEADREHFFYLKKNDFKWDADLRDYQTIKELQVGGVIGHNYKEKFQEAEKNGVIKVERVNTVKQNFEKLLLGRVDLVICQYRVGMHALKQYFTKEQMQSVISLPEHHDPVSYDYLVLSRAVKGNDKLIELFNAGLKKLKTQGRYQEILKMWDISE